MDRERLQAIRTENQNKTIGVAFSCFDLFHAGHILMLQDSKSRCDVLVVGLQRDPTVDRPQKNKPIQTFEERRIQVEACKYIDHVVEYCTEKELILFLEALQPDIRILGDDYVGKSFTGDYLSIPIYFHKRSVHEYSTTNLRKRIFEAESKKN